jgi:hypothetical protein
MTISNRDTKIMVIVDIEPKNTRRFGTNSIILENLRIYGSFIL